MQEAPFSQLIKSLSHRAAEKKDNKYDDIAKHARNLMHALLEMPPLEILGLWTCISCYILVCYDYLKHIELF